ncbi:MBL fold metallo-hydrolase [Halarsenatibacter silvermanii]|uniref:MBL fold metallo-hydrolase n=1 Tax=Halarsenatibacter silvermanii TaxID=321763 RepID=UPI000B7FC900|nr:MBL fold metallo-hydrolase [Halarsenatibacter silvermanii]
MSLQMAVLASGSSGNSIYVAGEGTEILIDAGLSGREIKKRLERIERNPEDLDALLLTHEHSDHINGAGVLSRRYELPIFASPGTLSACSEKLGEVSLGGKISAGGSYRMGDLQVDCFSLPHDASEPIGFTIECGGDKFGLATDIGQVTEEIRTKLAGLDLLVLEANHDEDLLRTGSYPDFLKRRIRGQRGHLSNMEAARLLPQLLSFDGDRKPVIVLSHLSEENNRPELAYISVKNSLREAGWEVGEDVVLACASRKEAEEIHHYRTDCRGGIVD